MKLPLFSFFAGVGFLDLGFEHSGFDIVFVNELHKPFLKSYKHSRAVLDLGTPRYGYHKGDISELLVSNDGVISSKIKKELNSNNIVGFIGGPPCPDFSIGGKNRGREGDNGKLSWTYVELICKEKPSFFLFENVKGLLRTKKHRTFYDEMKEKLHISGYVTTERLINALEYGVPQQRERVILIGFQRELLNDLGYGLEENINIIPHDLFPWENHLKYTMDEIQGMPFPDTEEFIEGSEKECPCGITQELTVEYWFKKNDILNHPNSSQHFKPRAGLSRFMVIEEGDDSRKSYKRLHRWRYSPTAAYGNNEVHLHPYKARRLSIAETLAIQSLPKEFEIPQNISLTNAFKMVGNGVPYLASLGIAHTILEFLGVNPCELPRQTLSWQLTNCQRIEHITT